MIILLEYPISVYTEKEKFKYPNLTSTNIKVFCYKTLHLLDCAGDN